MRIVLICGDRNWDDYKKILKTLKNEHTKNPITYVVEGGQKTYNGDTLQWDEIHWFGADFQGKKAARELGFQTVECEALWNYYGKKAGPIRNQLQLNLALRLVEDYDDMLVLSFHSDLAQSKGTADMVRRAKKAGVKVKVIK